MEGMRDITTVLAPSRLTWPAPTVRHPLNTHHIGEGILPAALGASSL